jgi:hypothetical protein
MIDKVKQLLYNRSLKRYQATNLDNIPNGHFTRVKTVGITFNAGEIDQDVLLTFTNDLKNRDKDVTMLAFFAQKQDPSPQEFGYFTLGHLSFSGIPKSDVVEQFISREFDVLINMDYNAHPALNYVCAASRALFKIGPATGHARHYDLMIDMQDRFDLDNYIREIRKTFNLIN